MPVDLGIAGQTGGSCSSLMDQPVDLITLNEAGRISVVTARRRAGCSTTPD
jgi:hypothetical protein